MMSLRWWPRALQNDFKQNVLLHRNSFVGIVGYCASRGNTHYLPYVALFEAGNELHSRRIPYLSRAVEPVPKFQAPGIWFFWFWLQYLEIFGSGSRTIWSKKQKKHCVPRLNRNQNFRLLHLKSFWRRFRNCLGSGSTALYFSQQ